MSQRRLQTIGCLAGGAHRAQHAPQVAAAAQPRRAGRPQSAFAHLLVLTDGTDNGTYLCVRDRFLQPTQMEYQATSEVGINGHRVRRDATSTSQQVGTIPAEGRIRLMEIKNGWGKLDQTSSLAMEGTIGYHPFRWEYEGWTMISGPNRDFFKPVPPGMSSSSNNNDRNDIDATKPQSNPFSTTLTSSSSSNLNQNHYSSPQHEQSLCAVTTRSPYYHYVTTPIISRNGMNVRRNPSSSSEIVGNIPFEGNIYLAHICNGWGKVHPGYGNHNILSKPCDLTTEGWVLMAINGNPCLQPIDKHSIAPSYDTSATDNNDLVSINSKEYLYKTTPIIPRTGWNIRQYPSNHSGIVGNIPFDGSINITHIRNGWGKLHPGYDNFMLVSTTCDLTKDGWVLISEDSKVYLQPMFTASTAPSYNLPVPSAPSLAAKQPATIPFPSAPPENIPLPSAPPMPMADSTDNIKPVEPPPASFNPGFVQIANLGVEIDEADIVGIQQILIDDGVPYSVPTAPTAESSDPPTTSSMMQPADSVTPPTPSTPKTVEELLQILKETLVTTSTLTELKTIEDNSHIYQQLINQRKVSTRYTS